MSLRTRIADIAVWSFGSVALGGALGLAVFSCFVPPPQDLIMMPLVGYWALAVVIMLVLLLIAGYLASSEEQQQRCAWHRYLKGLC